MIRTTQFGCITRFDLARSLPGGWHYWTTAYLVEGLLIDTGCAHCTDELMRLLEGIPLTQIVNTHSHEDHIGSNGTLQQRCNSLDILVHPLALAILEDPQGKQPLHPYRRLFWGCPKPSRGRSISESDTVITDHHEFQVIYTPGHSSDHICLYEPDEEWLFSGDLFVGGRERALRQGYDIWQIIASLRKVSMLPLRMLYPGSAQVRQHPADELQAKILYLEALGAQVLDLHHQGWSIEAITKKLCGSPMVIEGITLGHFSRQQLIRSYLGQFT